MSLPFAADQLCPCGHVAPLVTAPHLEHAVVRFPKVEEVIALDQLVAEFRKAHAAFQSVLHRVFGGHVIHGNVLADISNEIEEAEVFEPIVVVDYARCIGAFKVEKARELGLLTVEVVFENFKIQELAFGCFSTGVAYHACCTANERDRTVTRTLQVDQEHYWYKVANVQRVCSGVKSHIAGGLLFAQVLFEARHGVVQHAAPLEFRNEIHGCKGTIEGGEPKALKSSNELFELHGPRALKEDSPALNWMGRKVIF